jgi:hypothetical protein
MIRQMMCVLALTSTVGCADNDTKTKGPLEGTLQIEVLDTVDVLIDPIGDEAMKVTVTSRAGFGLVPENTPLTADGYIEAMPETGDTLYTAKLSAPANPDGPCGDEPVSLALSLHRQGSNPAVLGGMSAYCGADTWYGVPARVLRLAGPLPQ